MPRSACPLVSVIVAVSGNAAALPDLLIALGRQQYPRARFELVVVDNHADPVVHGDCLRRDSPVPCTVVHEPRPGLSRARNKGLRVARSEFVLFTDPDSRPLPGWISQMVAALGGSGAHLAGGRVLPRFTAGQAPRWHPAVTALFVPPAWPPRVAPLGAPYWLAGCNLALRRDPVMWFAEDLGVVGRRHRSCEDLELVVRCQAAGLEVVVVPDAAVERAIHPADVRARAVLGRAFWHGVSMRRLTGRHPSAQVYDSYQVGDALARAWQPRPRNLMAAAADLARIAGGTAERIRQRVRNAPGTSCAGRYRR